MKPFFPTLRFLFILTVSLLSLVLTVTLTYYTSKEYREEIMKHLVHYVETVAHDLTLAATDYIITENFSLLQDLLLSYRDRPHIVSICIIDTSRVIIAASDLELLGESVVVQGQAAEDSSSGVDFKRGSMQYFFPVRVSGRTMGWCRLILDTSYLEDSLVALQRKAVAIGFLAWLLACVAAVFLSSFFSRSIKNIMNIAREISAGNFNSQVRVEGVKEIRQLALAFHTMTDAIENREKLLKKSESRFRTLVEEINEWVWEVEIDGLYTYISPAAEQILGYRQEEFLGRPFFEFLDKNEVSEVSNFFEQHLAARSEFFGFVHTMIHRNGQKRVLETSGQPIFDEKGEIIGFRGLARDITQRYEAELALQEEKERLRVTLHSIGDGVITTDMNGRIVFLNRVAEELTGWSNKEASGRPSDEVFAIINSRTGHGCVSPVQQVIGQGSSPGLGRNTALQEKNGTLRAIADSGAPIRDRAGKIIGVVLVFRDISHEKKIEAELLKVKKLESVGVLAGGIAHDFNNILAAILGIIELVNFRLADTDPVTSELLLDAQKATKRAAKLTGQLLTFSKGGDPVKEEISLPDLITDSADFVLHGSTVKGVYSFPEDLWQVDADSGQIGQVIQNIIINAQHAMPEGGTVTISCANVDDRAGDPLISAGMGDYVRISIEDRGSGIPVDIIDKIFDPYFTTRKKGNGLGLAICHSIINKHNGYLTVESDPGQGTVFIIYLPALALAQKRKIGDAEVITAAKSARILVMDDDEMLRRVAASLLTALGHETILAADGEQAIRQYRELQTRETPVDLVILDLTIPGGMGGQEAAAQLLAIDPRAKIIVASGYSNDPIMANFRDYGFVGAIAKPFTLQALSSILACHL
jgi:PAS domain S-box-containing protein